MACNDSLHRQPRAAGSAGVGGNDGAAGLAGSAGGAAQGGGGAGTGGAGTGGAGTGGAGTGGAGTGVTGTAIDKYTSDSGVTLVPRDLTLLDIDVLVKDANGSVKTLRGAGFPDGTFKIPDVPPGEFTLRFGNVYLETSSRHLDFGDSVAGRPDGATAVQDTFVTFYLNSLLPWPDPTLSFGYTETYCSNLGLYGFALELFDEPDAMGNVKAPKTGDTSLLNYKVNYRDWLFDGRLVEEGKGDRCTIAQLAPQTTASGVEYTSVVRFLRLNGFTVVDGQDLTLQGAFTDVPKIETIALDVRGSEFMALRDIMIPLREFQDSTTRTSSSDAYISADSRGETDGFALVGLLGVNSSKDVNTGPISYANPYPTSWTQSGSAGASHSFLKSLEGTRGTPVRATITTFGSVGSFNTAPIRPLVGPALNPTVQGKDLKIAETAVTTTPRFAWSPPSLGTAVGYELAVWKLAIQHGTTRKERAATFITRGTELQMPPGILNPGEIYYVILRTYAGNVDLTTTPGKTASPWGFADFVSANFEP